MQNTAEQQLRDVLHLSQEKEYKIPNARISRALIDKLGLEDAKDIAEKILHEAHELQVSL